MIRSIKLTIVLVVLFIFYILMSVSTSNAIASKRASGSIITVNKKTVGLKYIGQHFTKDYYFVGRPSFTNYLNSSSQISNLPYYSEDVKNDIIKCKALYPVGASLNQFTRSGSALDPHITYNDAIKQISKISDVTGIMTAELEELIERSSEKRILGIFGEKIVNVLELNLLVRELHDSKI